MCIVGLLTSADDIVAPHNLDRHAYIELANEAAWLDILKDRVPHA